MNRSEKELWLKAHGKLSIGERGAAYTATWSSHGGVAFASTYHDGIHSIFGMIVDELYRRCK